MFRPTVLYVVSVWLKWQLQLHQIKLMHFAFNFNVSIYLFLQKFYYWLTGRQLQSI